MEQGAELNADSTDGANKQPTPLTDHHNCSQHQHLILHATFKLHVPLCHHLSTERARAQHDAALL